MKNTKLLIDTDVIIDFLRGDVKAKKFMENDIIESSCYISMITIAELYGGVREGKEKEVLDYFIQQFEKVEINEKIALKGGFYRRNYGKSHGVGLADAIIAATADEIDVKLVSLNKKHFPMLKQVFVPYQKD